MVQFTYAQLNHILDGVRHFRCTDIDVGYALPRLDSQSVILVHTSCCRGFQVRKYVLATGSVEVLPPHPLVEPLEAEPANMDDIIGEWFSVQNMKLSLRNLLAQRPKVTSTGLRLLQ